MAITQVFDGDTGLAARTKINEAISKANKNTGWGNFADSQYASGNPFSVAEGVTANLPNNKLGGVIESHLPDGTVTLYDGTRFTPDASGDAYTVRVVFTAETSSNTGAFALGMDISAAGDGSNVIFERASSFVRGIGVPQQYTYSTSLFSLGTFVANGGLFRFTSIRGNTDIYDISYLITKTHSGE